jgi:hypothetical protein
LIGEGNIEKSIDLASTACDLFEAGNKEHYLPNALMKLGCLQVSGKRYFYFFPSKVGSVILIDATILTDTRMQLNLSAKPSPPTTT